VKTITNCRFLGPLGINGIVLFPFILYRDRNPSAELIRHEEIHLQQLRRDGVRKFYLQYLKEYFQGRRRGLSHFEAYRQISYEREAFGDDSARAT
jgi:hypothetical protein